MGPYAWYLLEKRRVSKISFNAWWEFGTQLTFPTRRNSVLCTFLKVRKEAPGMWHPVDTIAKMLRTLRLETVPWVQCSALQSNGWVTMHCLLTSLYLHLLVYKEREYQKAARIVEGSRPSSAAFRILNSYLSVEKKKKEKILKSSTAQLWL